MIKRLLLFSVISFLIMCGPSNKKPKSSSYNFNYKEMYPLFFINPADYFKGDYAIGLANLHSNAKVGYEKARENASRIYSEYASCTVKGGFAERGDGIYSIASKFIEVDPNGNFNENTFSEQDSLTVGNTQYYIYHNGMKGNVEDLVKFYGDFKAVDSINFEVKKGEILGFLGPNGAGKTTTMKIITGYMFPTSGNITVDGFSVLTDSLEVRKKIGYLPESSPLYLDMGIIDYLDFVADIRKIPSNQKMKSIKRMIELCGLKDVITKNIGELSKGYRQRVGLAQALIHNPEVLILDEPTTGLDPNQIVEIRNLIKEIGKHKTVILSTHILPEVEATCDRVMIINRGKIIVDGTTEEIQDSFKGKQEIIIEILTHDSKESVEQKFNVLPEINEIKLDKISENKLKYKLFSNEKVDLREKIFDIAVNNQWKLLTLNKTESSLEDIFRELTTEDNNSRTY